MAVDPRMPVLVGVGAVEQRCEDPAQAAEPIELMVRAALAAFEDAGSRKLLDSLGSILVPRGFWNYTDPGRLVGDRLGARPGRTVLAEIGVLQQTILSEACRAIAAGEESTALVVGGEARYRTQQAKKAGIAVNETSQADAIPDRVLRPHEPLFTDLELQRGLMMPVRAFAVIESALRFASGQSMDAHLDELAQLWAGFSKIAVDNPHAWLRTPVSFEEIRTPSAANRLMAFPYARLHNSDWNVDQAGALLLCSVEMAQSHGIPEERWVYPVAATECNHVVSLSMRPELDRSIGARVAGARALELSQRSIDEIDHLDVYSCFPAPVRVFARELGIGPGRPLTVTGGMAFAGGPLNNYVLQSTIRMAEVLRDAPGETGLVTSVSGFLNKQGYGVWSTARPAQPFQLADVTKEVASVSEECELVGDYRGPARIAGYTVVHAGDSPVEGIAVCDLPDGRRTIGLARDASLAAEMTRVEFCGRDVRIDADGVFDAA